MSILPHSPVHIHSSLFITSILEIEGLRQQPKEQTGGKEEEENDFFFKKKTWTKGLDLELFALKSENRDGLESNKEEKQQMQHVGNQMGIEEKHRKQDTLGGRQSEK